jgi:SAM-dependent methyltransferase
LPNGPIELQCGPPAKPQYFMPPSDYKTSTTGYYDRHTTEFCENTFTVDVSALYVPFLREIPAGGTILDAGCGSGRDSLAFLNRGYRVVSIDASREMVAAATKHTGQQALLQTFDEIKFTDEFDGIWACGSLVHVARRDLRSVLTGFSCALKPNGVIYLSFKYGDVERMEGERFFNDMNEATLGLFLGGHPELELVHLWITDDLRNYGRGYQKVLNALVRRNAILESPREAPAQAPL